jgi:hypothetical protein
MGARYAREKRDGWWSEQDLNHRPYVATVLFFTVLRYCPRLAGRVSS